MISSCDGGRRRRQSGFTLLEVLVALAIAGLALVVMSEAATSGFLATKTAAGYQEALSRAKSHMAALSGDGTLIPGQAEGDDGGGYRWRYHVTEVGRQKQPAGLALYEIEVGVAWSAGGHRREVVLRTEQVGRPYGGGNG
ncbi:MAG TPA: prepilin-type N-terminal cleavage/methylation domain-containing protein [Telmatospirillum sp.]|nr:prepilin-type N-terminal cleavage/methylation domain-containing protein [Telmatospirillum sp.]